MLITKDNKEKIADISVTTVAGALSLLGLVPGLFSCAIAGIFVQSCYDNFKTARIFKSKSDKVTDEQLETALKNTFNYLIENDKNGNYRKVFKTISQLINDKVKAGIISKDMPDNEKFKIIQDEVEKACTNKSLNYTQKSYKEIMLNFEKAFYEELKNEDNQDYKIYKLLVDYDALDKRVSVVERTIKNLESKFENHEERIADLETKTLYEISLKNIRPPSEINKFIGRKYDIKNINTLLQSSSVVIKGMGGIGKSELARVICSQRKTDNNQVGWFNFEQSLFNTLLKIADPKQLNSAAGIEIQKRLVKEYLLSLDEDYLIVFDNIEKLEKTEIDFLRRLTCKFMITTRNLFDSLDNIFEPYLLNQMNSSECEKMFVCYSKKEIPQTQMEDLKKIINLTGHHTLVIELLAKIYTGITSLSNTTKLYNLLNTSKFNLSNLVSANGDAEKIEFKNHMLLLFSISNITNNSQIHVLKNMCIFPSLPVPLNKIVNWLGAKYENLITKLIDSGWLKCEENNIIMHNVISETLKMEFEDKIEYIDCEHMIKSLKKEIDKDESNPERYKAKYMPFCVSVVNYFNDIDKKSMTNLYSTMGTVYRDMGEYKEALSYYTKTIEILKRTLGNEHTNIATSYNNIAGVYQDIKDYKKALDYSNMALKIREEVLGVEHPDTAVSHNSIAVAYQCMGYYSEALKHHIKALRIKKIVLDSEHPDTAGSYNNIAGLYYDMSDYNKAIDYTNMALKIQEKVLGVEHPDTAGSYDNIANIYRAMGYYSKALYYCRLTIRIREKVLGNDHPHTASSYNNIASVYQEMGDLSKALNYFKMAIRISEKVFGIEHQNTANFYDNIAIVYQDMGNSMKALDYFYKSIEISKKVLGFLHLDTAASYNNIAKVYRYIGKYNRALDNCVKSFYIMLNILGLYHPNTKIILNSMKGCYKESGADMNEFVNWVNNNLAIQEKENKLKNASQ